MAEFWFPIVSCDISRIGKFVFGGFSLFVLASCASTYETRTVSYQPTEIIRPVGDIAEDKLLGVRIQTFNPGKLPVPHEKGRGISEEIRKAEGYFIAVTLKDTMQRSGQWGPVRVVPVNSRDGEVVVSGIILESDGESLKLDINVRDATGAKWFTKEYGAILDSNIYEQSKQLGTEAFQFLYNQIANDIALYRQKFVQTRVDDIRQVAELRFASDFAPKIFSAYLKDREAEKDFKFPKISATLTLDDIFSALSSEDNPEKIKFRYVALRLPSREDPMYQRIMRIRAREYLLVDTLDQQYDGLVREISEAYTQWRLSQLTEMNSVRAMEKLRNEQVGKAITIGILGTIAGVAVGSTNNCRGCVIAGGAIATTAINVSLRQALEALRIAEEDSKIHKATLEEASQSLAAEVKPIIVEVEGEIVELTGTVEAKFQQWRDVMTKIYKREVGPTMNVPPASSASVNSAS